MFTETQWIVGLWFLPVTLFILIPLAMLACWSVANTLNNAKKKSATDGETIEQGKNDEFQKKLQPNAAV